MKISRNIIVVIQSRLASTRLPAKALLPLCGIPTVVLCAKRAGNTGLKVIVATSEEEADNEIVRVLEREGIGHIRGAHDDVLKRFVLAASNLNDSGIVVRLTADNVFPDGEFIEDIIQSYCDNELDYLGTSSPLDGLPYGLSGEVFSARILRKADHVATSLSDREHVTPWIRANSRSAVYAKDSAPSVWTALRCTLDNFDDYIRLTKIFEGVSDPIALSWRELVSRLEVVSQDIEYSCPFKISPGGEVQSELTLGTAQLGMKYGIANKFGMPSYLHAKKLLNQAIDSGVTALDTARAYGESESRIGQLLSSSYAGRVNIITKLGVFDQLPNDASPELVNKFVDESVFHSCHSIRRDAINTLLLHRWEYHDKWGGAVWSRLLEHKTNGLISRLGASLSQPIEAIEALKDPHISHIQVPVNLLDWRWRSPSFLSALNDRPDVVWHARSVLLQGLLLLPPEEWPRIPEVDPYVVCAALDDLVLKFNREDRIDLCVAYVRSVPWITSLVIGMDDVSQLSENLRRFRLPVLTQHQKLAVESALPHLSVELLNPSSWRVDNEYK